MDERTELSYPSKWHASLSLSGHKAEMLETAQRKYTISYIMITITMMVACSCIPPSIFMVSQFLPSSMNRLFHFYFTRQIKIDLHRFFLWSHSFYAAF